MSDNRSATQRHWDETPLRKSFEMELPEGYPPDYEEGMAFFHDYHICCWCNKQDHESNMQQELMGWMHPECTEEFNKVQTYLKKKHESKINESQRQRDLDKF